MDIIKEMLANSRTIAVLGMKEDQSEEAFKIPFYMKEHGYIIYPVNPTRAGKEVLGSGFYDSVLDIKDEIDLVDIFRRPEYLEGHAKEILKMKPPPKYVWFQLGIYNDNAAKMLESAGIKVVQNRCIMVEHVRLF